MEFKDLNNSYELCCNKGACAIVKYTVPRHTCTYHKEEMPFPIYVEIVTTYQSSRVDERDLSYMV